MATKHKLLEGPLSFSSDYWLFPNGTVLDVTQIHHEPYVEHVACTQLLKDLGIQYGKLSMEAARYEAALVIAKHAGWKNKIPSASSTRTVNSVRNEISKAAHEYVNRYGSHTAKKLWNIAVEQYEDIRIFAMTEWGWSALRQYSVETAWETDDKLEKIVKGIRAALKDSGVNPEARWVDRATWYVDDFRGKKHAEGTLDQLSSKVSGGMDPERANNVARAQLDKLDRSMTPSFYAGKLGDSIDSFINLVEWTIDGVRDVMAPVLNRLPKHKRKHSWRVAKSLYRAGADPDAVHAAVAHDFLERGGTMKRLQKVIDKHGLSPRVAELVRALSSEEKNDEQADNEPLRHLQHVLPTLPEESRNKVILIKLGDRLDNLYRRGKKIGKNYRRKTSELLSFLGYAYTGPQEKFDKLASQIRALLERR